MTQHLIAAKNVRYFFSVEKLKRLIAYCPRFPNQKVNSDTKLSLFFFYRMYIVQDDFKIQNSILSRLVDLSVVTDFMSQNVS